MLNSHNCNMCNYLPVYQLMFFVDKIYSISMYFVWSAMDIVYCLP